MGTKKKCFYGFFAWVFCFLWVWCFFTTVPPSPATTACGPPRVCLQYTHYNSVYMVQYNLIYVTWKWVL